MNLLGVEARRVLLRLRLLAPVRAHAREHGLDPVSAIEDLRITTSRIELADLSEVDAINIASYEYRKP